MKTLLAALLVLVADAAFAQDPPGFAEAAIIEQPCPTTRSAEIEPPSGCVPFRAADLASA